MLIKFHQFDEYTRDRIRSLENKGHIGYIRYLMMRRVSYQEITNELLRLGLSKADESDYLLYFKKVIYPVIQDHKLTLHYKKYARGNTTERMNFTTEFDKSENKRQHFCACIKDLEIEEFFAEEIVEFYGGPENVPVNEKGDTIVTTAHMPDWTELLDHPKRHILDAMLVDGKTPKMIESYLDQHYDEQLSASVITMYANSFFRTRRRDLERTIDDLETEKEKLEETLLAIKETKELTMTIGEKAAAIGTAKKRIRELDEQIKRLSSHHSNAAFNSSLLDYAGMREMFADAMSRTYRRYTTMDERTEDDVVSHLSTLIGMLEKTSKNVLNLDEATKENSKKTVAEEMLEVVQPSMDRVKEEEEKALRKYREEFNLPEPENDGDILGMDEE